MKSTNYEISIIEPSIDINLIAINEPVERAQSNEFQLNG